MKTVEERLTDIVVEMLEVEPEEINADANFRKDLGADSLDLMELIMEIEREFDGEISDTDAQQITTFGEAIAYINTHLGE